MMQKKLKIEKAATLSYIFVFALFLLAFLYMAFFETNDVYEARKTRTYTSVEDYTVKEIADANAPAGFYKEYSWVLEDVATNEDNLACYLVHQYAQVYFDDELMYSLMPGEGNQVCKSVSSNWVVVPLYPEDAGKEVRVLITPAFQSVAEREPDFFIGSRYSIFVDWVKTDLPQIILSVLCIVTGLVIMITQICLLARKKSKTWDMFYLGNLSIVLGLWKITDTRLSPILFSENTLILGYITIGMLFLSVIPLLFFMKEHFSGYHSTVFTAEALLAGAVAFAALLCQMLGVAEFKQSLIFSHILIVISIVTWLILVFMNRKQCIGTRGKWNWKVIFFLLFFFAILGDLGSFYMKGTSSGVVYTIAAYIIYALCLFVEKVFDIIKKSETDAQTGLFNKDRWDRLMNERSSLMDSVGIIMIDLNRLKYINDTMGHEAGDKLILNFSNILRNSIPRSNTICRWGGDEFAVMVTDANQEKMESYLSELQKAVKTYNASGEKPEINFAAGYALSSQFPGFTRKELLQAADEQMYRDKQRWYRENLNSAR